jgi:hypothetical protein
MAALKKPTARVVWTQFSQAKTADIKPFLRVALGIENLRACDPPSAENAGYYARIQAVLGDSSRVTSNSAPADAAPADLTSVAIWTVKVDRSWLYERPSVGSNRHGYLIRGDHVAVIGEEKPDWVRIRYIRAGKAPLEAWLKRQDIAR